jgi:hypothetical protein
MLAAADAAGAAVDAAGADVPAGAALELLPELLHAAAATARVTPSASAGATLTACPLPRRACW